MPLQLAPQRYRLCPQAEDDDIAATESGGCLAGADPDAVSPEAIKRGYDQCGTLGAGNHFVEVQCVDEIFDREGKIAEPEVGPAETVHVVAVVRLQLDRLADVIHRLLQVPALKYLPSVRFF